jgi:hypothetical protein
MLVARLTDLHRVDEFEVAVAIVGPNGLFKTPTNGEGIVIEMANEYVLVTLRGLPLIDEGVHTVQVSLAGQAPVVLDIPVLTVRSPSGVDLH